jgi:hypothetical protein
VTADDDRLGPARHQARHVLADDRLAEDHAAEDVADGAVGRAVHALEAEFLDAGLIRRDGGAFHADAVLLDGVGRIDGDLVVGLVALFDAEVVVLEVDVEIGVDQLVLDELPDDAGHLVAVEFDDRVFDLDLEAAIADLNFVYATTARPRDGHKPVRGPVEAGEVLRGRESGGEKTGILFGRERIGLRNWEVGLADEIVTFPVNPAYASLNIAQAVLLMSYEWMKSGLSSPHETAFATSEVEPAPKGRSVHGLFGQIEEGLATRGAISAPRPSG